VHRDIALLDHHAWPDLVEQFRLCDNTISALYQRKQQVESAGPNGDGSTFNEQLSLDGTNLEPLELVGSLQPAPPEAFCCTKSGQRLARHSQ